MVGANSLIDESQLVLTSIAIGECSRVPPKSYMKHLLGLNCVSVWVPAMHVHLSLINTKHPKLCGVNCVIYGKIFATALSIS